jgi:hypothetical protein
VSSSGATVSFVAFMNLKSRMDSFTIMGWGLNLPMCKSLQMKGNCYLNELCNRI